MPRKKSWKRVQGQRIVMARKKLEGTNFARGRTDNAESDTSRSSENKSPVTLQANQSPVTIQANQSPVTIQADQSPVALQANQSPVALQANQSPVTLQANQSPVALQANTNLASFSRNEHEMTNENNMSRKKMNLKSRSFQQDSCIAAPSSIQGKHLRLSHIRTFTFGSFHQADKQFSLESRGSQCTVNALCALIYANFSYFDDANCLDSILIDGDCLYNQIVASLKANNMLKCKLLNFDELPSEVMLLNKKVEVVKFEVISGVFIQQLGDTDFPSMHQSLHTAFQISSYLLFMIGSVCSAVFKKDDEFFFFDSHSHRLDGMSAQDGKSMLVSFYCIEDLVSFLYAVYMSMNIDMNSQFDLLPLHFREITSDTELSLLDCSCSSSDKSKATRQVEIDKSWTKVSEKRRNPSLEILENKKSDILQSSSDNDTNKVNGFSHHTLIGKYFRDQLKRTESIKVKDTQNCKRKTYQLLYKQKQRQSSIFKERERKMSSLSKIKARESKEYQEKEKLLKRSFRQNKEKKDKDRQSTIKTMKKVRLLAEFQEKEKLHKRLFRQIKENKEKDRQRTRKSMRNARLSAEYQEKEKLLKRSFRQNEENKERDRQNNLKTMKKARLSAEYQEKEKLLKRSFRQNEENKERDRQNTLKTMKKARLSAEYQEKEKLLKRSFRQNEENKEKDRQNTFKTMKKARLSAEFQEKEKILKRSFRQIKENKEKDRQRTLKSMKKARISADFQEKEKLIKRSYRQIENNKEEERKCTLKSKQKARNSREYQEKEKLLKRSFRLNEKNKNKDKQTTLKSKRIARKSHEHKVKECQIQRDSKRRARLMPGYLENERLAKIARRSDASKRQKERISDRNRKAIERKKSLFCENESAASKQRRYGPCLKDCIDMFHEKISVGPIYVCSSCHQTWFRQSVSEVKTLSDELQKKYLTSLKSVDGKQWICSTCRNSISNDRVPKLSVVNGMKWPLLPKELELFPLEERLICLRIPFMQIRELPRGRQLSVKGNVINVPVDIQPVVSALPRAFDENITVPVKLKKRLSYKSCVFSENVRPLRVLLALHWLMKHSLLYENSNIEIDKNWIKEVTETSFETVCEFFCKENDSSSGIHVQNNENVCSSNLDLKQDIVVTELDSEAVYDSDDDEIATENVGNIDTMLEDTNLQNRNQSLTFAPGEGQQPLSIYQDIDSEYLCFPSIFCGQRRKDNAERFVPVHYSDIAKWELRSQDRRAANSVPNIFFKLKKLQMKQLNDKVNLAVRRCQSGRKQMTVEETRNPETINDIVRKDEGFFLFKQIRNSPSYLETKKKDVFAMIRQLGLPTWFISLSSADTRWIDLLKMLANLNKKLDISEDKVHSLTWEEKTKLIQSDPVTCSRYFDYRVREFINTILKSEHNPLGELTDYFYRVEFQQRGSPHIHMIVWINNSPKFHGNSREEIAEFVDKFLQCSNTDADLDILTDLQVHKHSRTCRKKKDRLCRFGYPLPPLPKTMILDPLEDEKEKYKKMYQDVQKQMNEHKEGYDISYEVFLDSVIQMSEDDYIKSIRSSLNTSKVFLKRSPSDIRVNLYNKDILKAWKANIDIQFVLDPYACAMYIVSYISKSQRGMSSLLHAAAKEARNGNLDIKRQVRHIGNVFSNSVEVSAQEAVYLVLQMPLTKSTRDVVFINTSPSEDRVQLLKSKSVLDKMPANSTDILADNIIKRYSKRPRALDKYCLADYVSQLDIVYPDKNFQTSSEEEVNDDEENGDDNDQDYFEDGDIILTLKNGVKIKRRSNSKVIRYVRFNKRSDEENFYREKLMLFLPWRNEGSDILGNYATHKEQYEAQKEDIDAKCSFYEHHAEELELAREAAEADNSVYDEIAPSAQETEAKTAEEEVMESENFIHFNPDRALEHRHYDIGIEIGCSVTTHQVNCNSGILPDNQYRELLRSLNAKQTQFYNHVIHWIKTKDTPLYAFLTGGAGVGKSVVIRALYQTLYRHLNLKEGQNVDEVRVLLCAYTGKAAFNINGSTISSAFRQKYKQSNQTLTCDSLNSFRSKFRNLSVVIIDEVSMVGNTLLSFIDQRLQELKGTRVPFGGVSIIAVGDLYQLKPINSDWIFNDLKKDASSLANNLWQDNFSMFELTEVMRQKDDLEFAELLNRLRKNELNSEDEIKLRECNIEKSSDKYMMTAPHLFAENYYMHLFNDSVINSMNTEKVVIPCHDIVIAPHMSKEKQTEAVRKLPDNPNTTASLQSSLVVVVGMIYDLTVNINTEDGLANGASCVVKYIEYKQIETKRPSIIWVQFDQQKAGMETRIKFKNRQFYHCSIDEKWTPIFDIERSFIYNRKTFQRIQFPLQPSAGRSVHRAQGSTLERVVVDLSQRKSRKVPHLHYVALSRVRSQKNLQILNFNKKALKVDDQVKDEMARLQQNAPLELSYVPIESIDSCTKITFNNCRSLHLHFEDIKYNQGLNSTHVIALAETRLVESDKDDDYALDGFKLIRNDQKTGYTGARPPHGLAIYVKDDISIKRSFSFTSKQLEFTMACIDFSSGEVQIVVLYKAPNLSPAIFVKVLENELVPQLDKTKPLFIMGDFNLNINDKHKNVVQKLCKVFSCQMLMHEPTTDNNSILDLIFSNTKRRTGTVESYWSDHKIIVLYTTPVSLQNINTIPSLKNKGKFDIKFTNNSKLTSPDETITFEYHLDKRESIDSEHLSIKEIQEKGANSNKLPTSKTWISLASKLYNFFFAERLDSKLQPHFNTLKSLMETDIRFSENRCNKVLPVAESSYQEGLPSNYTTHYHLQKLAQAKRVFSQFARGPACDKYLKQLEEACERFWKNGKQLCEDVSLTGNPCINPLHRTEDQLVTESNSHLPIMNHSNQFKMKAACNCGTTQADKDDPFDHKAANYDFYIKLEETCCGKLDHFIFPVFESSTTDARAASTMQDLSPKANPQHSKVMSKDSISTMGKADVAGMTSNLASLSLALSLGQSGGSDMYGHGGQSNCSPFNDGDQSNIASNPDQQDGSAASSPAPSPGPIRQHSTTEYLPGMIHTESPTGLLPKFPSWSLVCRGKGSLYNHNQGLDLPGFLSGSNFLLPWDIPVTTEKDKWPSVGESTGKKGKQKKSSRTKELMEIHLRVYIGEEYECPRGHRFFCSGPEKIIKVSSTSTVKDNANKLIKMDMPLYCQCHCRSSKGYMAQLMRIYVVTPEGPLKVSLNPLVQPNPPPCPIFHPGTGEEIDLTPGHIWVLRSVYMGDNGVFAMPTDASQLPGCRLLSGTFNFRETTGD